MAFYLRNSMDRLRCIHGRLTAPLLKRLLLCLMPQLLLLLACSLPPERQLTGLVGHLVGSKCSCSIQRVIPEANQLAKIKESNVCHNAIFVAVCQVHGAIGHCVVFMHPVDQPTAILGFGRCQSLQGAHKQYKETHVVGGSRTKL
jgi:xanthosine utilization system XapX-like protein